LWAFYRKFFVWEQRKLGDIAKRIVRKNKNLKSTLVLTISAQYGLVDQKKFFNKNIAGKNIAKYYLIEKGEFAYNKSYSKGHPLGVIKRLDYYDVGILSTLYIIFKPENINSNFLSAYYDTKCWYKEVTKYAAEGARNHGLLNIPTQDFFKTELIITTNNKEQQRIGNIIKIVNKILDLQKRKLDNLIKIRKFYLSKFFPTKRKAEPELRLKKSTNISWKNKKLGEIGKVKSGIGFPTSEQGGKVGVPFYKVSDMNNKGNEFEMVTANNYVSIDRIKANRWKVIREVPAIFFAKVGAAVLLNRKRLCRIPFLLDNNTMAYCMDQAILDPIFTKMLFETINLPSLAQLGALPSYNASDVESLFVYIPTLEEQKKLAKIFQKIDNLIVYQQKKISLLKQNKEFLLQNLFI
jgi:type I restriction enzyme S subunit